MWTAIVLIAILFVIVYFSGRKKKAKIPECYHCDSKDTFAYNQINDIFYCSFCERALDTEYVANSYHEDYHELAKYDNEKGYEAFKKARKESLNIEKTGVACNENPN